jgi:hypothetical protein
LSRQVRRDPASKPDDAARHPQLIAGIRIDRVGGRDEGRDGVGAISALVQRLPVLKPGNRPSCLEFAAPWSPPCVDASCQATSVATSCVGPAPDRVSLIQAW